MTIGADRIEAYLRAYGESLAAFDSAAAVTLWGTPGMILSDTAAVAVDDRETMAAGLEQGYPLYRELGLAAVDHELLETHPLTERLVRLRVRWIFRDADGAELTDSTYVYVLRDDDDDVLRAYLSISIDAEEKLAALAARSGMTP